MLLCWPLAIGEATKSFLNKRRRFGAAFRCSSNRKCLGTGFGNPFPYGMSVCFFMKIRSQQPRGIFPEEMSHDSRSEYRMQKMIAQSVKIRSSRLVGSLFFFITACLKGERREVARNVT